MDSQTDATAAKSHWFVGAMYDGNDDQTARFLRDGIWENGYEDRYLDIVRTIQKGDRIAIKSAYTRRKNLPFDNRNQTVSVMGIKAIGTVQENPGTGRTLKVDWQQAFTSTREWYFYTNRTTIWRVLRGTWDADALISFAFEGKPQDLSLFCNAPSWRERFGDKKGDKSKFLWTRFYEEIADKLLSFRNKRAELVAGIHAIGEKVDCMSILNDEYEKGVAGGPLKDICPFTAIAIFNRSITDTNRKIIAEELAHFLGVTEPVPPSFEGVPLINNQRTWFFGYSYTRKNDDIDVLWDVFEKAIKFADTDDPIARTEFASAYDNAAGRFGVGWNLTMGLFWIRPWNFPTLEAQSQHYIDKKLNIRIGKNGPKNRCNSADYLAVTGILESRFQEEAYPIHSYPELSLAAWLLKKDAPVPRTSEPTAVQDTDPDSYSEAEIIEGVAEPYTLEDIIEEGCFIERKKLDVMLNQLNTKRNLILQGPPGTGKTWLAKRLAFALMGERDDRKLRAIQFHPNLSYEDFIRGWRPSGDGKLTLVDGPFLDMMELAASSPKEKHVVVIEEINRGNPAQIFGEMLTLLEVDKRTPNEALELSYKRNGEERVFIPDNLYVIGTMNIADRSIAMVDLALRRRFAFVELEPAFGAAWQSWLLLKSGISAEMASLIEERITKLNDQIAKDKNLGRQFRLGHSYVTPHFGTPIKDAKEWFRQVVETEISPLLDEYWFDNPENSQNAKQQLLEGF